MQGEYSSYTTINHLLAPPRPLHPSIFYTPAPYFLGLSVLKIHQTCVSVSSQLKFVFCIFLQTNQQTSSIIKKGSIFRPVSSKVETSVMFLFLPR